MLREPASPLRRVAPGLAVGALTGVFAMVPVLLVQAARQGLDATALPPVLIAGGAGAVVGAIVVPLASWRFAYPVTRARFLRVVAYAVIGAWIANVMAVAVYWDGITWIPTVMAGANIGLLIAFGLRQSSIYQRIVEVSLATWAGSMLLINSYAEHQDWVDPQGGKTAYCDKFELAPVPNTSGLIVTGHHTDCDWGFGLSQSSVYVYLHPIGRGENRSDLIFRYYDDYGNRPKITWKSGRKLTIRIKHVRTDKMLSSLGSVQIDYYFDRQDHTYEPPQ